MWNEGALRLASTWTFWLFTQADVLTDDCDGEIVYTVLMVAPKVRPLLILRAARGLGRASIVDAKSDSTLAICSASLVQAAIL